MSFNRKYLWSLALLMVAALIPAGGFAAPPQGGYGEDMGGRRGGPSPEQQLQQLTKTLRLTAEQQTKVKPILVDGRKKMNAVRDDSTLDRRAMFDKMMQIRKDTDDKVRTQLNDQQKDKFDKMLQERAERMQERSGGGAAGSSGDNSGGSAPAPAPQN